ncbi:MAG TPA: acyltransferase family protein [Candidatus Nanopelagicales bacterium]
MSSTLTRPRASVRGPALPRLVGLDGVRAVAVIAVVLYHADVAWLPGGFLGVDVFFVLSGFLITSLLLVEFERTGRLDYKEFYLRRARRLLPALFAMLAVTAVLVATVAYDGAAAFRRDVPGAMLYYSNWLSIVTDTSYFEFIGRPPMLKHLWSLAVEEQFYLVWPTVALLAFRWRGARMVGLVALGGAVLSTIAMTLGSVLGDMPGAGDPSRLYFGTDTHAMGVLVGAALAVVWRPGRTAPVLAPQARAVITGAGVAALVLLVACFVLIGEYSTFLYRGGFLLVAAISAVLVAACAHRGVPFGRWLGMRPMRWIGQRSYGIYLWHWPLFLVTRPSVDLPVDGAAAFAIRITLLLGIAELSYRYVEMPVRRGALGRAWLRLREQGLPRPDVRLMVGAGVVAALVVFTGVRIVIAPAASAVGGWDSALTNQAALLEAPLERDFERMAAADQADPRPKVTAFGDSVLIGASPTLERTFNLDLNARVGEQAIDQVAAVEQVVSSGALRDRVLLHLGSNGIITESQLRGILDQLTGADQVLLVNVRVPRRWMEPNNALFAAVAGDYANVRLIDWAAASADHREWFVDDRVHLTSEGARQYAALIAEAAGVPVQR